MKTNIEHLSVLKVAKAGVFDQVNSYEEMVASVLAHGGDPGEPDSPEREAYSDRVGEAFEVYTEFFFIEYGTPANPGLGVLEVKHTSQNKFQAGYDFTGRSFSGDAILIQSKFRGNPTHKFTRTELANFVSVADEEGVESGNRVLFTNLDHDVSDDSPGVFLPSYKGGLRQMRVLGRGQQEGLILRDPSFWGDLRSAVASSAASPAFGSAPPMWDHQQRMTDVCAPVMDGIIPRGRVICVTGGGKTRVEYQVVRDAIFGHGVDLCVVVAPRIDLLIQHHEKFKEYGIFHRDGVVSVHFRTGDEARTDAHADYEQTTKKDDLLEAFREHDCKNFIIFVTYASEEKLFSILKEEGIQAGLVVWDEFHHTVRQDKSYREHLLSIPSNRNLFFSASEKLGRTVSSVDESLYGPKLISVTYAELRNVGILVPSLKVKAVRMNPSSSRVQAISRDMKKAAERENFDIKVATIEAAAIVVARADMLRSGRSNIVTFSKSVPMSEAIVRSEAVRAELDAGTTLQVVHSGTSGRDRRSRYVALRASDDSILCQHSILVEGADFVEMNGAILSRSMDVTGTQQAVGRIVRASPADTARFTAGEISLDSPDGWTKHGATVYVVVHDHEMDDFGGFVLDLVRKLRGAGLRDEDYQFSDLEEEKHGRDSSEDWMVPISGSAALEGVTLSDYVRNLIVEDENNGVSSVKWGSGFSVVRDTSAVRGISDSFRQRLEAAFKVGQSDPDFLQKVGCAVEQRLPAFMAASSRPEKSLGDLTDPGTKDEERQFLKYVGIDRRSFASLVKAGLFDIELLDEKVLAFHRQETDGSRPGMPLEERLASIVRKYDSIVARKEYVMTPSSVVEKMLDLLPAEVMSSPSTTFLDPACGKGTFLCHLFVRRMLALASLIPDEPERARLVVRGLHGCDVDGLQAVAARDMLLELVSPYGLTGKDINVECKDFLSEGVSMKFDVVIGNPPYQKMDQENAESANSTSASALYHHFHFKALKDNGAAHVVFVVPAKCLSGGKGLSGFREDLMLGHTKKIVFNENSTNDWFGGAGPQEGHVVYHYDVSHSGNVDYLNENTGLVHSVDPSKYDIFLRDPRASSIIDKVLDLSTAQITYSSNPFGLQTNHFRMEAYSDPGLNEDTVECAYNSGTAKRGLSFRPVRKSDVTKNMDMIHEFKVITAGAFGGQGKKPSGNGFKRSTTPGSGTGNIFILQPGQICTMTYLVLASLKTFQEAQNLKSFMHTAFAQYLIVARKQNQHIVGALGWLPSLDWSKQWTSADLYSHFGLNEEEVFLIESEMVNTMRRHSRYLSAERSENSVSAA